MKEPKYQYGFTNTRVTILERGIPGTLEFGVGGPIAADYVTRFMDEVNRLEFDNAALTERVRVLEATLSYVEQEMSDPQKGKFTALQVVRGVISSPLPAGPGDGG